MEYKVRLDENGHALGLRHRLNHMRRDLRHCDFIISVGENEYHAHRNILSAGSDYFDAMLTHDTKENQLGRVEMMDVDSECVKVCIDYIYTGKAEIPDGKAVDLMFVAQLMQLNKLCDGIAVVLGENLSVENIFKIKAIADKLNLKALLTKCFQFARENISQILTQSGFPDESKQFLFDMFKSRNFSMTEEEKLVITLDWVKAEPANVEYLPDFVDLIRLQDTSLSYRKYLVENEPLIMNNDSLLKAISTSISIMDNMEVEGRDKRSLGGNLAGIFYYGSDSAKFYLQYYKVQEQKADSFYYQDFEAFLPCSFTVLHSYIYGLSEDKSVHRLRIADENAKWEKMQNMIEYHGSNPRVVPHDGSLYVIGGGGDCCTAASERYLPDENKWVKLTDQPLPTDRAALVSSDEYIYSAGGVTTGTKILKTFSRFSPSSCTWVDLPPMLRAYYNSVAAALDHRIYIFSGYDGTVVHRDVNCFDVVTSQWTSLPPMSVRRCKPSVLLFKGVFHVFGGDHGLRSEWTEQYDVKEGTWTKKRVEEDSKIYCAVKI